MLARHGWRKITPRPRHPEADPQKLETFKKKFPEIVSEAVERQFQEGRPVRLMFQDDGRFGRINEPRLCWAPKGIRPDVHLQFVREYTLKNDNLRRQSIAGFKLIVSISMNAI